MALAASNQGRMQPAAAAVAAIALSLYAIARPSAEPVGPADPVDLYAVDPSTAVERPLEASITFDAMERLDEARISHDGRRGDAVCERQGQRARCGGEGWNFVGPYADRSLGRAVRCIWVHPGERRKVRRLNWTDVPMGARAQAALVLLARSGKGKAVRARVTADDQVLARLEASSETGVAHIDRPLPPGPQRGNLAIVIDADDNHWRLACLSLRMVGRRAPAPAAMERDKPAPRARRPSAGTPLAVPPIPQLRDLMPEPASDRVGNPGGARER